MHKALLSAVADYVERRFDAMFHPEKAAIGGVPQSKPSPLFSELTEDFLSEKAETTADHRGYSKHTQRQARVTFELWIELMGDRPVRTYTLSEADQFRKLLLSLPASHRKGAKFTAREAIAAASGTKKLSQKTTKRHFSTLRQYWLWLTPKEHVDRNIFSGHSFPGTKASKKKREDWAPQDLEKLFRCKEWRTAARDSAMWWFPLIGLHSGLRLEEIARLRPAMDIADNEGVWCFIIQKHKAPWSIWDPKTEAGARIVPVHDFLIRCGLLKFVQRRRDEGAMRLFPELLPSGDDDKLSATFSREFSRLKISLGVHEKTVFHSFRHTFRTVLESTDFKESWIDAVLGHESTGKSVGRVYAKRVAVPRLNDVVQAFESPLDLTAFVR